MVKTQRPVGQFAEGAIKVFVDRAGIDKEVPGGVFPEIPEIRAELDADIGMFENPSEHRRKSIRGHFK